MSIHPQPVCVFGSVFYSLTPSSASERSAVGEVGGNTLFSFLLPFGISVPAAELLCFSETPFPTASSVTLPKPACPSVDFFTFQGRHLCIFFSFGSLLFLVAVYHAVDCCRSGICILFHLLVSLLSFLSPYTYCIAC